MFASFLTGAIGYPLLEIAYRKRTHYSMALAGGFSFCWIRTVSALHCSLAPKVMLCGLGITLIEFACGIIWNRHYQVWDYRNMPLNYQGQICLPYSLLWCGLSLGLLPLIAT